MVGNSKAQWRERVEALLQAVRDVRPPGAAFGPSGVWSAHHQSLFVRYVHDLQQAIRGAHAWWNAMVETQLPRSNGDQARAAREVARRNPVGPVADRGVIAVLRRYWLECEALNSELEVAARVLPEDFVLGHLARSSFAAEAQFLAQLPYWPLGLSADGRWI